jgi:hypothetical protein
MIVDFKKISDIKCNLDSRLDLIINWKKLMGELIGKNSSPKEIKNEVLTIFTTSSSWSHHINALRHDIMRKVRDFYGVKLKKIVLINSTSSKRNLNMIPFYNESIDNSSDLDDIKKDFSYLFYQVKDKNIRDRLSRVSKLSLSRLKYFK